MVGGGAIAKAGRVAEGSREVEANALTGGCWENGEGTDTTAAMEAGTNGVLKGESVG